MGRTYFAHRHLKINTSQIKTRNLVSFSQEMAPAATQLPTPETQDSCDIPPHSSPYVKPPKPPLQFYLPTSSILTYSILATWAVNLPVLPAQDINLCSSFAQNVLPLFLSQLIPKSQLNCPTLEKPYLNLQCQVGLHGVCFHCIYVFLLQHLPQL